MYSVVLGLFFNISACSASIVQPLLDVYHYHFSQLWGTTNYYFEDLIKASGWPISHMVRTNRDKKVKFFSLFLKTFTNIALKRPKQQTSFVNRYTKTSIQQWTYDEGMESGFLEWIGNFCPTKSALSCGSFSSVLPESSAGNESFTNLVPPLSVTAVSVRFTPLLASGIQASLGDVTALSIGLTRSPTFMFDCEADEEYCLFASIKIISAEQVFPQLV